MYLNMASSEFEHNELNSTPKLSLHLLPSIAPYHPPHAKTLTPPIQTLASVPFKWEEAPGKPRPCTAHNDKPKCVRSLDLPPRLLPLSEMSSKLNNMPSPTTVLLDGPYIMGRTLSFSSSLRKNPDGFGSRRWSSFRKHNHRDQSSLVSDPMRSIDFSTMVVEGGTRKVDTTKVPRRSSFLSLSQTRSHLLVSIYESLKLAVPWRRRQQNVREMSSH